MVTASSPSASARAVAAATTWSMVRPWRGPCRGTAAGSRQSSWRVRAGSPAPVRADGIGNASASLYVVLYTLYNELRQPRQGEQMKITASAVSLNVDDVAASAQFLTRHF